jgi:hypothetical protein
MADEQGGLGEFDELSKSRAALLAQQNRLVEMLAERNKPSDFEFYSNLARGFSDPNAKSFAQGLGSAVGNLQEGSERQRGKDLQMYQIRSQLAQSQYDLDKQNAMARQVQQAMFGSPSMGSNDALKMAAQAGLPAGPTVEAASLIGAPTQQKRMFDSLDDQTKRMIAVQARIDPAKAIDSLAKMGIEIGTKNATKTDAQKAFEYQLGLLPQELQGSAQQTFARSQIFGKSEDTIAAISTLGSSLRKGEITPDIFKQNMAILQNKLTPGGNQPQAPASAPSSTTFGSQASASRSPVSTSIFDQYAQKPSAAASAAPFQIASQGVGLSTAERAQDELKRIESVRAEGVANRVKANEPYVVQQNTISNFSPMQVGQNINRLSELEDLVKRNPEVVGLMVRQGPIYALLQSMESGITTPYGSISVPVSEALAKLKLNENQQAVARNITQIISDLNQQVMKEGKSIFGPAISVYDAQQMAKPGFKETDPASFIRYLANKQKVTNHFMGEMNSALSDYREKNPDAGANKFFTDKNSPYKRIVQDFNATFNDLVKNRSPYR